MRAAMTALLVLAALPALAREMTTLEETPVRAEPKKNAAVVATLDANVRVHADERKDNWFRVTVEIDEEEVSGWVHRRHVQDVMGRSKGQLLAENKRLYAEVVELRKTVKQLGEELAAARKQAEELEAELAAARATLKALKEAVERAGGEPMPEPAEE